MLHAFWCRSLPGGGSRRGKHHCNLVPAGSPTADCVEKPTVPRGKSGPPFNPRVALKKCRLFEKESDVFFRHKFLEKRGGPGRQALCGKTYSFPQLTHTKGFSCGKNHTFRLLRSQHFTRLFGAQVIITSCHHVCLARTFALFGSCWFGVAVRCVVVRNREVRRGALRCAVQSCVAARGAARCVAVWRSAVHVS